MRRARVLPNTNAEPVDNERTGEAPRAVSRNKTDPISKKSVMPFMVQLSMKPLSRLIRE
jgi:hypothetical protein